MLIFFLIVELVLFLFPFRHSGILIRSDYFIVGFIFEVALIYSRNRG